MAETPTRAHLQKSSPRGSISVSLPPLMPGTYQVFWRVLSDDGHTMAGVLRFTLQAGPTHIG